MRSGSATALRARPWTFHITAVRIALVATLVAALAFAGSSPRTARAQTATSGSVILTPSADVSFEHYISDGSSGGGCGGGSEPMMSAKITDGICGGSQRPPSTPNPNGASHTLQIGGTAWGTPSPGYATRWTTLMDFDLSGLPPDAVITEALLTVEARKTGDTVATKVTPVTGAWSEDSAALPTLAASPKATQTITPNADTTIDVTAPANAWLAEAGHGLALALDDGADPGMVEIYAREKQGFQARLQVDWTVDAAPPTVAVVHPADGQMVFATETLVADAADDTEIDRVEFLLDDVPFGTVTEAPYELPWDTTSLADGSYTLAARAVDSTGKSAIAQVEVRVANALSSVDRVNLDYDQGALDVDDYVTYGMYALFEPSLLPDRFLAGSADEHDASYEFFLEVANISDDARQQLQLFFADLDSGAFFTEVEGDDAETSNSSQTLAAADVEDHCRLIDGGRPGLRAMPCSYTTPDGWFELRYTLEGFRKGVDRDDGDDNGLPDVLDDIIGGLQAARQTYVDLEYIAPSDLPLLVRVHGDDGGGFAPPPGGLRELSGNVDIILHTRRSSGEAANVDYLARHELFHVFQWSYARTSDLRHQATRMFMEASAEWATDETNAGGSLAYANDLDEFLGRPAERLDTYDQFDFFSENREYGAFIFAKWLAQEHDKEVIRHVWEGIADGDGTALEVVRDLLTGASSSFEELLPAFAQANYRLGASDALGARHVDADNAQWIGLLEDGARTAADDRAGPRAARILGDLSSGTTQGDIRVGAGGVAYVDLWAPNGVAGTLEVELTVNEAPGHANIDLLPFADHPQMCDQPVTAIQDPLDLTSYTVSASLPQGCSMATLAITHVDPLSGGEIAVAWDVAHDPSGFRTGDVLVSTGSGTVEWFRDGVALDTLATGLSGHMTGMAVDGSGQAYVTGFSANQIARLNTDGSLQGTFGSGYNSSPESLVFRDSGNLLVGQADGAADVLEFDPAGSLVASYDVETEVRGSDWIDLADDDCTLFYTSEGVRVMRYDICTDEQLPDYKTLPSGPAFGVQLLDGGGVLVATREEILHYDVLGFLAATYGTGTAGGWFGLALDGDRHFWATDESGSGAYRFALGDQDPVEVIQTAANQSWGVLVYP